MDQSNRAKSALGEMDRPMAQIDRAGTSAAQGCDTAYQEQTGIRGGNGIGWAVKQLWNGGQVRRRGWNGRGMHLALQAPDQHSKMSVSYVYMKTAEGHLIPWVCSQSDLLGTDWELAEV